MSRISRATALRAIVLTALVPTIAISAGCYHYHLRANGNPLNSSYYRKTLDSSGGNKETKFVVPPADSAAQTSAGLQSGADCKENGLYEVGITSKWQYAAGTVFSFGQWSRVQAEWKCAKEPPVIGPRGVPRPPSTQAESAGPAPSSPNHSSSAAPQNARQPLPQKTSRDALTKRTVNAFFWGALQQNLLPPAAPGSKTPANCMSMRQVRLPMNYGYALITVFSAGIWSPMRVAWQCWE